MQDLQNIDDAVRRASFAEQLRTHRLDRNLSINELARLAGIAKSNLARLEAGDGNPSLETLWALSAALGVNVRELIDPEPNRPRVHRVSNEFDAHAETADFAIRLLSTCPVGATRDLYRATLQPGSRKISDPHPLGTIEHVVVVSGKALIGPISAAETLSAGDYMTFSASQEHIYEALEPDTSAIIVMENR